MFIFDDMEDKIRSVLNAFTTLLHSHIQCKQKCWLFYLLQRRQKASTALCIVREYKDVVLALYENTRCSKLALLLALYEITILVSYNPQ